MVKRFFRILRRISQLFHRLFIDFLHAVRSFRRRLFGFSKLRFRRDDFALQCIVLRLRDFTLRKLLLHLLFGVLQRIQLLLCLLYAVRQKSLLLLEQRDVARVQLQQPLDVAQLLLRRADLFVYARKRFRQRGRIATDFDCYALDSIRHLLTPSGKSG